MKIPYSTIVASVVVH